MLNPTIVQLEYGTTADGYTFNITNNRFLKLKCWYDGDNILLEPNALGKITISEVIYLICGLLHEKSNFKKILFREYCWLKPKCIKSICFTILNYECVITPNSNPDEVVREYYRFQGYDVYPDDLADDILERQKLKLNQLLNKPVSE